MKTKKHIFIILCFVVYLVLVRINYIYVENHPPAYFPKDILRISSGLFLLIIFVSAIIFIIQKDDTNKESR